jgi:tetratricopeptide (TPR) repeat protein
MARTARWICAALMTSALPLRAQTVPVGTPTYSRDVAPILERHCVECHRPDGDGPFSLATYADARRHATQLARVTATRYMPPWKPSEAGGPFVGERRLSPQEIDTIGRWADTGAAEGSPVETAPPQAHTGWLNGPPDIVLQLASYTLRADGPDTFRNFTVRVPGTGTRYVRGLQFRPGSRAVHHANIRIDRTPASRLLDEADPDGGYEGLVLHSADFPSGQFLGWTPGQAPPPADPDLAWPIEAGSDLVVQLHLYPTGKAESIAPLIGLYLSDRPPTRSPSVVRLGRQDLDIAANATDHRVTDRFVLPVDVQLLAVQPHAHYRATSVQVWATAPGGARRPLLFIPSWDFAWQDQYRYASPTWLGAGTAIEMEYRFDNSTGNARNPDQPSRRVEWGWRSTDEMADVWLQVLTRSDDDRRAFEREARQKMAAEDAIGSEHLVARTPDYVPLRNDLALIYLELGRPADALRHFAAVTALQPQSAAAHYNEGTALEALGRTADAGAQYRRAIQLDPAYSAAHNNLGNVLAATGHVDDAVAEFRRAVDIDGDNVEARNNLGGFLVASAPATALEHLDAALRVRPAYPEARFNRARALAALGRTPEAAADYRAALAGRPDWPPALINLAWLLAADRNPSHRRPPEAVGIATRAVALTHGTDPAALDVLAAAQAASGNFEAAIARGQQAVGAAEAAGRAALAADIRARIDLYRHHQPFVVD